MNHESICEVCGASLKPGASICPDCGWDLTVAATQPMRRSLAATIVSAGLRVVFYGLLVLIPVLGFMRLQSTGPGPDLETTLRWMVFGDDGRAAELVTIHRAHEISLAASRFALRELESLDFQKDNWADALHPFATIHIRGWIPMIFMGADTGMAPTSVKEFYEVRKIDGWNNPYSVTSQTFAFDHSWENDPEITADLEAGLRVNFFRMGVPDFEDGEWMRLALRSAGPDGTMNTADDLVFTSYMQVGLTIRLQLDQSQIKREIEVAYTTGKHFFRLEGNHHTLLDARQLAEFRAETIS
ncbi:MAG: hypothetical protein GY906_26845 [bacterium]|nr:hypothetical protein [bacterium]